VQVDRPIAEGVVLRILSVVTLTNEHRNRLYALGPSSLAVIHLPQRSFQRPVQRFAGAKRHRATERGFKRISNTSRTYLGADLQRFNNPVILTQELTFSLVRTCDFT
jgi:hypothetical protein